MVRLGGPSIASVAAAMLDDLEPLADAMVAAYRQRVPYYAALPADGLIDVRRDSLAVSSSALHAIANPAGAEAVPRLDLARATGRRRAAAAVPLGAALEAFRIGRTVLAEELDARAAALGVPEAERSEAQRRVADRVELLMLEVTDAYLEHVKEAYEEERRRLLALAELAAAVNASLDLDEVIAAAVDQVRSALSADWAAIRLEGDEEPLPEGRQVSVKLEVRGRDVGSLVVGGRRLSGVDHFLRAIAAQVAMALAQALDHRREARTDFLTGLGNRGEFDRFLRREVARAERYGTNLTLVLIDLDDLKLINDRDGHAAGDAALKAVGDTLLGAVRAIDLAARIGGDEFAVIMPDADQRAALDAVERCREQLGGIHFSCGVATWNHGQSPEALTAAADAALYRAKRGRRRGGSTGRGAGGPQ